MQITSVERRKSAERGRKKDMLSVYVDGHFAFNILEEDYLSLNLYEKKDIEPEEIEQIKNTVIFRSAKSAAIKYLTLKLRSEGEVSARLQSDGYDAVTVEKVTEELKGMGYINDRMYARKHIYDRCKLKPQSKKLLKLDLKHRGISDEIINEVLDDWEMDEESLAESLVRRKFGKYDLQDEKIVKRVYSFLHHRGFSLEQIQSAVSRAQNGDIPS